MTLDEDLVAEIDRVAKKLKNHSISAYPQCPEICASENPGKGTGTRKWDKKMRWKELLVFGILFVSIGIVDMSGKNPAFRQAIGPDTVYLVPQYADSFNIDDLNNDIDPDMIEKTFRSAFRAISPFFGVAYAEMAPPTKYEMYFNEQKEQALDIIRCWKTRFLKRSMVDALGERLLEARSDYMLGKISKKKIANREMDIIKEFAWEIRKRIKYHKGHR